VPKAQNFFDDAEHWLHGTFAQAIDGLADLGLKFVSHLDDRRGIVGRRSGLFGHQRPPILMMRAAPGGDIRLNAAHRRCRLV